MRAYPRALGIELTRTRWRAVHLEARLVGTYVLGHVDGEFEEGLSWAPAALEQAVRVLDVRPGTRLVVALSRPVAHLKPIALPRAPRAQILEAVSSQAASIFPFGKHPIIADLRRGRNGWGRRLAAEGLVAATSRALMVELAETAGELGLRLVGADVSAGTVRHLLPRRNGAAALVHEGGLEWVRYGRRNVLRASRYYPLPRANERDGAGRSESKQALPDSISSAIASNELTLVGPEACLRALGWHSPDRDSANGRWQRWIGGVTGLEHLEFLPACGACLEALGAPPLFDLRPDWLRDLTRKGQRRRRLALVGFALLASAIFGLEGLLRLRLEVARLEQSVEQLRPQAEAALELQAAISEAAERAALLSRLVATQPRWTRVLTEVARVLPKDAYLTSMREQGGRLRLEGYAVATSDVITALSESMMFDAVRLAGSVAREPTPSGERDRFAVEFIVVPGRPAP